MYQPCLSHCCYHLDVFLLCGDVRIHPGCPEVFSLLFIVFTVILQNCYMKQCILQTKIFLYKWIPQLRPNLFEFFFKTQNKCRFLLLHCQAPVGSWWVAEASSPAASAGLGCSSLVSVGAPPRRKLPAVTSVCLWRHVPFFVLPGLGRLVEESVN